MSQHALLDIIDTVQFTRNTLIPELDFDCPSPIRIFFVGRIKSLTQIGSSCSYILVECVWSNIFKIRKWKTNILSVQNHFDYMRKKLHSPTKIISTSGSLQPHRIMFFPKLCFFGIVEGAINDPKR